MLDQYKEGQKQTGFNSNKFIFSKIKRQRRDLNEYAGIYNDTKTLIQFYLKTGPHADTHTQNEKKPESLFDPSQP